MVHSDSKLSMCGCRFYRIVTASVLNGIGFGFIKGPFIFYEHGGAGGIWGGATRKKMALKGGATKKN